MISALLLSVLVAAPAPAAPVLARVDQTAITRTDLDERLGALAKARRARTPRQAVGDLVDEALLAAEARRQRLDQDPSVQAEVGDQRRRLALDALIASITDAYEPPEATLRDMFHATADSARLVIVKLESEALAKAALERVRKGTDILAEARASSLASSSGDTGLVSRVALAPPIAEAAFKAKVGDLVGPIALPLGWAIAKVLALQVADEKELSARREGLVRYARGQMAGSARQHLAQQVKAKAKIALDEEFLKGLATRNPTPADLDHPFATVNGVALPYRALLPSVLRVQGFGHGRTAGTMLQLAGAHVESHLLEQEALARGFDKAPAVAATLPGIERNVLAGALASKIGKVADVTDPAVKKRLDALRAASKIWVDEALVASLDKAR